VKSNYIIHVIWVVTSYTDVVGCQRFGGTLYLHFHGEKGGSKVKYGVNI